MEANSKSKRYINSPHKCTLCVKGFNYDDVLQNHMTKHEPVNIFNAKFPHTICGKTICIFSEKWLFRMRLVPSVPTFGRVDEGTQKVAQHQISMQKMWGCESVPSTLAGALHVDPWWSTSHIHLQHLRKDTHVWFRFCTKSNQFHFFFHELCFRKRTMFQKHMRIHYPSNKIACDKCGKLFKTIETLRAHML